MATPYHPPRKYSLVLHGHRTSVSLEPVFWDLLTEAAAARDRSVNALAAEIDAERIRAATPPGLASAIRVWLVANADRSKPSNGGIASAAAFNI